MIAELDEVDRAVADEVDLECLLRRIRGHAAAPGVDRTCAIIPACRSPPPWECQKRL